MFLDCSEGVEDLWSKTLTISKTFHLLFHNFMRGSIETLSKLLLLITTSIKGNLVEVVRTRSWQKAPETLHLNHLDQQQNDLLLQKLAHPYYLQEDSKQVINNNVYSRHSSKILRTLEKKQMSMKRAERNLYPI